MLTRAQRIRTFQEGMYPVVRTSFQIHNLKPVAATQKKRLSLPATAAQDRGLSLRATVFNRTNMCASEGVSIASVTCSTKMAIECTSDIVIKNGVCV